MDCPFLMMSLMLEFCLPSSEKSKFKNKVLLNFNLFSGSPPSSLTGTSGPPYRLIIAVDQTDNSCLTH